MKQLQKHKAQGKNKLYSQEKDVWDATTTLKAIVQERAYTPENARLVIHMMEKEGTS